MAARRLPESAYNWTSIAGALLAVASISVIVLLVLIDSYVQQTTVYLGLVTFVLMPVFLIAGLVLIAVGIFVEKRRLARGEHGHFRPEFHVNLRDARHRNVLLIFTVGTTALLLGTSVGTYNVYHESESVEFCGLTCHNVMHPEYTAYQSSPHARVSCADCHIGAGADWFVKSKLSGAYQVYAVLAGVYPKPIPTPVHNLRPARETCEQCHWPQKGFGATKDVNHHFLADEENTPWPITMLINVGGGSEEHGAAEGIHWHIDPNNRIEYAAADEDRMEIEWVRLTDGQGDETVWTIGGDDVSPGDIEGAEVRTMDCIDCHNRPSHKYPSPMRSVNQALAYNRIDRSLPYIKREAVYALDNEYEDTPTALAAIDEHLRGFYADEYPEIVEEQAAVVDGAVAAVQEIYRNSFFPEMKVTWREYPDHIGHSEYLGCFRCHGSALETADGETISKDCTLCHTILAQGDETPSSISPTGMEFVHPVDIWGEEFESNCTDCHEGGAELY
jgi:nitrate/TMAO reductase-like tetraheme cytochrome c subunit